MERDHGKGRFVDAAAAYQAGLADKKLGPSELEKLRAALISAALPLAHLLRAELAVEQVSGRGALYRPLARTYGMRGR